MKTMFDDFGDKNPEKTYKCRVCGKRFPHNKMGSWGIVGPKGDKHDIEVAKMFNLCKSCFEKENSVVEQMVNELENIVVI